MAASGRCCSISQKTLEHYQQASKCGDSLIQRPGFQTHQYFSATTLIVKRYPKAKLAHYQLHGNRSEFQASLNDLQKMMILPANGAERNLMHLLAYNLLRSLMWQSAQQSQVLPR